MAGQMTGADVEQLRDLARQLDDGSRRVDALGEGVRARLAAAPWVGQRADDYRRDFTSRDLPALRSAAAMLSDAARVLRRNADEQERTSATGSHLDVVGPFVCGTAVGSGGPVWRPGIGGLVQQVGRVGGVVADGLKLTDDVYGRFRDAEWLHRLASGEKTVLADMAAAGEASEWGKRDLRIFGHGLSKVLGPVGSFLSGWEIGSDLAHGDWEEAAWDTGGLVLPAVAGTAASAAVGVATWGGGVPAAPVVYIAASAGTSFAYEAAHEHFHPDEKEQR